MTGSLSVRGDVLPIGGVTYKIEAAALAGIKKVIIPRSNLGDVLIEDEYKDKIEIIPVTKIEEVLEHSLVGIEKAGFIARLKQLAAKTTKINIALPDTVPAPAIP
jgi:Lon-like ATP-dependent protease